jgi:hypothetical protein
MRRADRQRHRAAHARASVAHGLVLCGRTALAAGDRDLAALSNLKLARLEGSYAELPGQDREAFRGFARSARKRPSQRAAVAPRATGGRLVGRLAEAAVEFGDRGARAEGAIAIWTQRTGNPEAASIAAPKAACAAGGDRRGAAMPSRRSSPRASAGSRRGCPSFILLLADTDPSGARSTSTRPMWRSRTCGRCCPGSIRSPRNPPSRSTCAASSPPPPRSSWRASRPARRRRGSDARREIVEAFRQAELQSAFGSECLPARAATDLDNLLPGETILYPLLLPDRVELLVVSRDQGGRHRLSPPAAQPRGQPRRRGAAGGAGGADAQLWRGRCLEGASSQLYVILIAPVADRLGPNSLLAVVPDGPLRALPFAALVAPDGRFLVQQTRLSTIPALAFSQPAGGRGDTNLSIVAASLQRAVDLPVGAFTALQGTEEEARIAVRYCRTRRVRARLHARPARRRRSSGRRRAPPWPPTPPSTAAPTAPSSSPMARSSACPSCAT